MQPATPLSNPWLASLANLPAYYALYAWYADMPVNAAWLARQEDVRRMQEYVRVVQPLLALGQPYRKTWALRLFTERASLAGFPPELVQEAWRQVREQLERIGPPPGWRGGEQPRHVPRWLILGHRLLAPRPRAPAAAPRTRFSWERPPGAELFPKSPVDYRQAV
ncbi:MAG TPA: hypothetical protein VL359_15810 [bacterium]|nr:hypothetical protein [bacterium]